MANTSNLPTIQRLKFEDYNSAADWKAGFQLLINSLNLFMTPVYNILNGDVEYQNLAIPQLFLKTITAATVTTFTFANPLRVAPSAVILGNCWSGISSNHPAVALQVFWHSTGGNIVVDNIVGLSAGTIYNIVLVIL